MEDVNVYADGACLRNGQSSARAGMGVYFGASDPRNVSKPLPCGPATNQRAELASILAALVRYEAADNAAAARRSARGAQGPSDEVRLVVHSDSEYAVNCVGQWGDRWTRNGWASSSGRPAKNADLVQALEQGRETGSETMEDVNVYADGACLRNGIVRSQEQALHL
ncbi:ribonuclease H, putative [Eimeria mitis]|uniref:ribonuclease H n=1 Tax=Eimeria mitis TaxID=44415 RepID=U6JR92_9EIME|nr:ribonuclease H, putative [Eimeria mitis]CDJ27990.1 ribonuclease H, putative [Eimeria mitis]